MACMAMGIATVTKIKYIWVINAALFVSNLLADFLDYFFGLNSFLTIRIIIITSIKDFFISIEIFSPIIILPPI